MKTPIDVVRGRIVDIDERRGVAVIECPYTDWRTMTRREYRECNVQFIDSRKVSDKQRRTCYMLIREISKYTGMGLDPTKEYLKLKFLVDDLQATADHMFSLSDAPVSLVCAFQRFLVNFVLDWEIPCSFPLLNFVDDVQDYVYACLAHKTCCICGRPADLHHTDHVGTGRNRDEIIHEGMKALPLCRGHHEEDHKLGELTFQKKYHLCDGIPLDKTLCRIYQLKRKEEQEYAESLDRDGTADT